MSDTAETPQTAASPFAALLGAGNPFLAFGAEAWRKAVADHVARVEAVTDEFTRAEAQGVAHTRTVIDESARLAQETLSYAAQLSSEWRKMMFALVNPSAR